MGDTLLDDADLTEVELEALTPKKRRGRPRERGFLTELKHSFAQHGAFFFKIPDLPHFKGQATRFDLDKPFDAVVAYGGLGIAIEAKSLRKYEAFGLGKLRMCQLKGLDGWVKSGCRAFVFINVRQKSPHLNRLLILDWAHWRPTLIQRSLTKREMEALPYILGKGGAKKKITFELKSWLMNLATHQIS